MKLMKKLVFAVLVAATTMALAFPAMASSTKISGVTLKLEGSVPVSGDDTESMPVEITTTSNKCSVVDGWTFDTKKETWKRGETPVIVVELEANDDYKFASSTSVNVNGLSSSVKSKSVKNSGESLKVYIKIKPVGGDVSEPGDVEWVNNHKAGWEEVDEADYYEVELKRNNTRVATILTDNTKFNFHQWMTKKGSYKFRVRTVAKHDGKKSSYSEYSEEVDIDEYDVYNGNMPTETDFREHKNSNSNSGNNGSPSNNGQAVINGLQNTEGQFVQNANGWFFVQNYLMVTNMWVASDGHWYHIGPNGYMQTGWFTDVDGHVYYLNPVPNGTQGAMLMGLQNINGILYYFNEVSDAAGPCGSRRSGYTLVKDKWYFFDVNTGAAWMNCATPNGLYAGPDGVILFQ